MTQDIRELQYEAAKSHGFAPPSSFQFAAQQPAIPIQLSELGAVVPLLPLAFAKLPDESFMLTAITGFGDGKNLLVDDAGRWGGRYLPMHFRVYPFSLLPGQSGDVKELNFTLAFDHASGLYRESPGAGDLKFFNEDGTQQEVLKVVSKQLAEIYARQVITQTAVRLLAEAKLLKPWNPEIKVPGTDTVLQLPRGLYAIGEGVLASLSEEWVVKLHKNHALAIAYAQLLSMSRISVLLEFWTRHQKLAMQHLKPSMLDGKNAHDTVQLAKMLGDPQGETLKFDWMK